jgi:hypothetical protein
MPFVTFCNKLIFYGEDHPLLAVRDCLFSTFVATLLIVTTGGKNNDKESGEVNSLSHSAGKEHAGSAVFRVPAVQ